MNIALKFVAVFFLLSFKKAKSISIKHYQAIQKKLAIKVLKPNENLKQNRLLLNYNIVIKN